VNRMETVPDVLTRVQELLRPESYRKLHWEGTFEEYLQIFQQNPRVARSAFQRLYDMILSYGYEWIEDGKDQLIRYRFFYSPPFAPEDAVYGLERHLMQLVNIFKAAARGYGPERRVILLHGPVGSSKSTIVRLLKRGLEEYSKTDEGALYSFSWIPIEIDPDDWYRTPDSSVLHPCPINEEPLKLIPTEVRDVILEEVNRRLPDDQQIFVEGDLCPPCRFMYRELMRKYQGDWNRVIRHVRVRRLILSEKDRVGIGTFQPKDEKNQDSTELTGDINYRKIAIYGSDSDPRAFNFDGEFCVANRGLIEFIEVLKLDVAFLYDLLGASQEHLIKPKKFAQTYIDEVIIGHTNEPEYRKLQNNEYMEALRDRTIKVDIPYVLRLSDEIKIYQKYFNPERVRGKHIAPHTLEVAAMWAILTRLEEPKIYNITLMQKLKLYNGKMIPGFTADMVAELRKEARREGMFGISPRYVQDKISNALVADPTVTCVNPFMVMNEMEAGLDHHSLISSEDQRRYYRELMALVRSEYEEIIKNEVQQAIVADEEAINRLFLNYIDNVRAYTLGEKIRNKYTGQYEEPDERLMRSIEEKIDIPENRKDDFRRELMNYIGALAVSGKGFDYRSNERLYRALQLKLFEDQKDAIKLSSLVTSVVDKETQEKIDIIKARMKRNFGYCDICASDVLHYVASIFARGDIKQ
jgi:serine protein kinase